MNLFNNQPRTRLVNMKDMLTKAAIGHYAIPAININNMEFGGLCYDKTEDGTKFYFIPFLSIILFLP